MHPLTGSIIYLFVFSTPQLLPGYFQTFTAYNLAKLSYRVGSAITPVLALNLYYAFAFSLPSARQVASQCVDEHTKRLFTW